MYLIVLAATLLLAACGSSSPEAITNTYITSTDQTRLVFELDVVEGESARQAAKDYVVAKLGAVVDKPDGLEWKSDGTFASRGADHKWTFSELQKLAKEQLDLEVPANTSKIHVMYVDGTYEDGNVLGVAWANKHLVMFSDVLEANCSRPLLGDRLCAAAESSVLLHEVGHVIGLVDNGVEMVEDHKDAEHGAHDSNEDCVMYWAYDGVQVLDVIASRLTGTSSELDFDAACKADLAAARAQ